MGIIGAEMKALPDDTAMIYHHGPDHRIRACRPSALRRQAKSQGHVAKIMRAAGHRFLLATRDRLRPVRADFLNFALDGEEGLATFLTSASAKAA